MAAMRWNPIEWLVAMADATRKLTPIVPIERNAVIVLNSKTGEAYRFEVVPAPAYAHPTETPIVTREPRKPDRRRARRRTSDKGRK